MKEKELVALGFERTDVTAMVFQVHLV